MREWGGVKGERTRDEQRTSIRQSNGHEACEGLLVAQSLVVLVPTRATLEREDDTGRGVEDGDAVEEEDNDGEGEGGGATRGKHISANIE